MRLLTDEKLRAEVGEIVLEIRQYLCNTEFAPQPFTEPIDPKKLTQEFPEKIIKLIAELTVKEIVEDLETFICEECSTPNFVNIVLPKEKWVALKGSKEAKDE